MRKLQIALVGIGVLGGMLLPAGAADADSVNVGVNGCTAGTGGGDIATECYSITVPGYYYLSINNPLGGYAHADVNCTQGGSFSTDSFDYGYLNGGLCTVFFYADYVSYVSLGAF
jgi:hypothetical protein